MAGDDVLVTRRLPAPVMDRLESLHSVTSWDGEQEIPRDRLLEMAAGKRAIITLLTERVDDELLDAAGDALRIVANYAVGYDNVDLGACTARSVLVSNTPDVLTEATADMAFALLMAAARRVAEGDRFLRSQQHWIWAPEMLLGQAVFGRTLGLLGYGRIGRAVARRAAGFGMRILFHDPAYPECQQTSRRGQIVDGAEAVRLDDLLSASDFISVHVSLNDATRHLIGTEQLATMKPTAVLVNTARGPVVNEEALAEALDDGTIFAAGLDVFENEPAVSARLLANPRVVLTPHLGSATVDTRIAMGMLAVDNVVAALRGERPPTLINEAAWQG